MPRPRSRSSAAAMRALPARSGWPSAGSARSCWMRGRSAGAPRGAMAGWWAWARTSSAWRRWSGGMGRPKSIATARARSRAMRGCAPFARNAGLPVQGRGEMLLAHSPATFRELAKRNAAAGRRVRGHRAAAPHAATWRGSAALLLKPYFGVHPLRLVRALADHAVELGVRVHPRSEVTEWRREGARHRLVTAAAPSGRPRSCWRPTASRRTGCTRPLTGGRCR